MYRLCSLILLCLILITAGPAGAERPLIVGGASSLTEVLPPLLDQFRSRHPGPELTVTFAGSGVHRVQIERGAPIDVFVFAGRGPVASLVAGDRVGRESVRILARNQLVLVVRTGSGVGSLDDLLRAPGLRLAVGDPVRVPAGEYGDSLLARRSAREALEGRIVRAENVRQVLRYVETGVTAGGLVYATDALRGRGTTVAERYSWEETGEIVIVGGVLRSSPFGDRAETLLAFLAGPDAAGIWEDHGFLDIRSPSAP